MERFFLNLKMERVWQRQARRDIIEYIVGFYNLVRLHSTFGYLSSVARGLRGAIDSKNPIFLSKIT